MDIGLMTFSRGACAGREGYVAVAEAADRLGYGFLDANDHVAVPTDAVSRYPYMEAGTAPWPMCGSVAKARPTRCPQPEQHRSRPHATNRKRPPAPEKGSFTF